jgi:tRNA threonylcarbamoyladenosine biosynthesis protein TsaB
MILLLDTSTPNCELTFYSNGSYDKVLWNADRSLARDLNKFIDDNLSSRKMTFKDIKGLGVFEGPGSFTGLRIGITVFNSLANALDVPIIGAKGEHWKKTVISRLDAGENSFMILPFYGSEVKITLPKK